MSDYINHREQNNNFVNRWTIENIQKMTLEEYCLGTTNRDSFCWWLEYEKTNLLGGIGGAPADKRFVIYYNNQDERYKWSSEKYGSNEQDIFEHIRNNLIKIIELSQKKEFNKIDSIKLPNMLKWKVAFLYSDEKLVPIYSEDALKYIAKNILGLNENFSVSGTQIAMMNDMKEKNYENVHLYAGKLWMEWKNKTVTYNDVIAATKNKLLNDTGVLREIKEKIVYAKRTHRTMQNKLAEKLKKEFPNAEIEIESEINGTQKKIDVKLVLEDGSIIIYEVKPYDVINSIREGLGQLLDYYFLLKDKPKKIVIVGCEESKNKKYINYIDYIKRNLNINFDYEYIEID